MFAKVLVLDFFSGNSKNDGKAFGVLTFRQLSEGARDIKIFVNADIVPQFAKVQKNDKIEIGFELTPDRDQKPTLTLVSVTALK